MTKKYSKIEQTLIIIKPEAIQRQIIGELIAKFERRGLKLVGCKLAAPTEEQIGKHYPDDEEWYKSSGQKTYDGYVARGEEPPGEPVELAKETRRRLIDHFTGRPVLLMAWEGPHAVALGRKTVGSTNPLEADIGSIRGDYSTESYELADGFERAIHTLVHASGSVKEAKDEMDIWFKEGEIVEYDFITELVSYTESWGRLEGYNNDKEKK
jgi:nucleoside-diphosphate kinase